MSGNQQSQWVRAHQNNIWACGPLPPLVNVVPSSDSNEPRYVLSLRRGEEVKSVRSSHHPLSPMGRNDWADVLPLVPEYSAQPQFTGVARVPVVYQPHEWVWDSEPSIKATILKALQISGVQVTLKDLNRQEAIKAVSQLMHTKKELYHPQSQIYLTQYPGEHRMSNWARYFKRSLVIVAPEVSVNSNYWEGFGNVDSAKRGEVRPRYSTGKQDQYRPMFLGCLSRDGVDASTKWFVLTPSPVM